MTKSLESTQFATVFLPSNAAFAAASVGPSISSSTSSLISNHVVGGFAGYLPILKDGTALTTQNGESLVISIRNGIYYVNGAKIIQANIITENGVVHIIDKVSLKLVLAMYKYSPDLLTHFPCPVRCCQLHHRLQFLRVVCCPRQPALCA